MSDSVMYDFESEKNERAALSSEKINGQARSLRR